MSTFHLPMLPPSKNDLREIARGRLILTKEYREWKKAAGWEIKRQRVRPVTGNYRLEILAAKPRDKRWRDLGNILEATEDLLTWMRVIEDDHLSAKISLEWSSTIPSGVNITVEAVEEFTGWRKV